MKKRVKLLTTIASLCLAVALMAFGVYAATSANLTVNSTVSFTVSDVDVKWEWKVVGGTAGTTGISDEDQTLGEPGEHPGFTTADTTGFDAVKFNSKNKDQITYTFTCTNIGNSKVKVTPVFAGEGKSLFANADNVVVTYSQSTNAEATAWEETTLAAKDAFVTFTVVLELQDYTKPVTAQTLNGVFNAGLGA